MPTPKGFASPSALSDHFNRHGRRLGHATDADYEQAANDFLNAPVTPTMHDGVRAKNVKGDTVRFDEATGEFCAMNRRGFVKSYMRVVAPGDPTGAGLRYYHRTLNR